MANFDRFLAVVGFFRSSGYFKLRKELNDVEEIKILVGINIDDIFRCHNKAMLMLENAALKSMPEEEYCKHIIPTIPIQMIESWMLADKELLKRLINAKDMSDADLGLDRAPESYADPFLK